VLAPGGVPQAAGQEEEDPEDGGKTASGAPHVLVIRTPGERLTWLRALGSRRKEGVTTGVPALLTGFLITDGYRAYQQLLPRLAGVQQCCQHVIRRCRAVTKLGPGSLQSWAGDVISILREAHQAVEEARARGDTAPDPEQLEKLRQRYDEAAAFGVTHNRLRDWHNGNHPGYALGCWLQEYQEQVWLFTREFAVEWTSNSAERAVKGPKRHQAVSGCWHTLATLARWCRIRTYLDSAASHGLSALDAIRAALEGNPGYHHSPHWRDARSSNHATREWTQRKLLLGHAQQVSEMRPGTAGESFAGQQVRGSRILGQAVPGDLGVSRRRRGGGGRPRGRRNASGSG
jgi:hypothetical protein